MLSAVFLKNEFKNFKLKIFYKFKIKVGLISHTGLQLIPCTISNKDVLKKSKLVG